MRKLRRKGILSALLCLLLAAGIFYSPRIISPNLLLSASAAASNTVTVNLNQESGEGGLGKHDVSDTLYGVFFEDINYGADGGLNAEMVVNNSFQFQYLTYGDTVTKGIASDKLRYWEESTYNTNVRTFDAGTDLDMRMSETNDTYLALNVKLAAANEEYWIANHGYQGGDMRQSDDSEKMEGSIDRPAMAIAEGHSYRFSYYIDNSFYYKSDAEDNFKGEIEAYLRHPSGELLSNKVVTNVNVTNGWTKISGIFEAKKSEEGNLNAWDKGFCTELNAAGEAVTLGSLVFKFKGTGRINLDFASVIDVNSWGMDDPRYSGGKYRTDLVEAIADMNPSFFRFPGGCVAEGDYSWENVYNWENTIGKIEDRKGIPNTWEYYQSFGIGFYEYFLLCEDLDMEPLPVVSAGLICQGRMTETGALMVSYEETQRFKTDVVDRMAHLIFYAKGDPNSSDKNEAEWAAKRVKAGHTEPFELNYLGIGNENWGDVYWDNFDECVNQLSYYSYNGDYVDLLNGPFGKIVPITTTGVDDGSRNLYDNKDGNLAPNNNWVYHDAWDRIDSRSEAGEVDGKMTYDYKYIVDEHYYESFDWYTETDNLKRYDADNGFGKVDLAARDAAAASGTNYDPQGRTYERDGAKIFVGEYSCNQGGDLNNLRSAIAEAAYMTSLERNSDLVAMASYAPLFGKQGNTKWEADALFFNPVDVVKTPNYYIQSMFGSNTGSVYIPDKAFDTNYAYDSKVAQSITLDEESKTVYVKLVNYNATGSKEIILDLSAVSGVNTAFNSLRLSGAAGDRNTIDEYAGLATENVKPVSGNGALTDGKATVNLPAYSATIYTFTYGESLTGADASFKVYGSNIAAVESGETEVKNTITVPYGALAVPRLSVTAAAKASTTIEYADSLSGVTKVTVSSSDLSNQKVYLFDYKLKNAPEIIIKSAVSATITLNRAYVLDYDAEGDVTITLSGGKYIPSTRQFIALSTGTFTITLTSDIEPNVQKIVTVTVVNSSPDDLFVASNGSGGLPVWALILIIIESVFVFGLAGFCVFWFVLKDKFFKKRGA